MVRRRRLSGTTPRDPFTEWWWAPSPTIYRTIPAGYSNFEHVVLPEIDPGPGASFAFTHEFRLVGGDEGLMALCTSSQLDAGAGKIAVFSMRGTLAAESGRGGSVLEDGSVCTCRVPYPWEAGRPYGMRVWTEERAWWSAAVRDQGTGQETLIGRMRVPDDWRRLASQSVSATRYEGPPLGRCVDLPECQVAFREPTADDGRVKPVRHENHLGPGTCETSHIADVRDGVRHGMGGSP